MIGFLIRYYGNFDQFFFMWFSFRFCVVSDFRLCHRSVRILWLRLRHRNDHGFGPVVPILGYFSYSVCPIAWYSCCSRRHGFIDITQRASSLIKGAHCLWIVFVWSASIIFAEKLGNILGYINTKSDDSDDSEKYNEGFELWQSSFDTLLSKRLIIVGCRLVFDDSDVTDGCSFKVLFLTSSSPNSFICSRIS